MNTRWIGLGLAAGIMAGGGFWGLLGQAPGSGDAAYVIYAPSTPGDWTSGGPGLVAEGLDELAERATDLVGPGGTDNHLVRWDGTTGLQDSGITCDDAPNSNLTVGNKIIGSLSSLYLEGLEDDPTGGEVVVTGGVGYTTGGDATIRGGSGYTTGGDATIGGGSGDTTGGDATIRGGSGDTTGGNATISGGPSVVTDGDVLIGVNTTANISIGNGVIPIIVTGALTLAGDDPDFGALNITNVGNVDGRDVSADGTTLDTAILDADFGATGLMVETGAGAYTNRSIAVDDAKLTIANGDGVAGNPSLGFGSVSIDDLNDVNTAGVGDHDVLTYAAGSSSFVDTSLGGGLEVAAGPTMQVKVGNGLELTGGAVAVDLAASSGLKFLAADLAIDLGIADDDVLQVDDAAAADDEYCQFTANGIEGRNLAERLSDNRQGWYARRTSAQAVGTGAWTLVEFDAEDRDTQACFNTTTHLATPPAGRYRIWTTVYLGSLGDGKYVEMSLYKDGGLDTHLDLQCPGATTYPSVHGCCEVDVDGTETLGIYIKHNHGAARDIWHFNKRVTFSGERIE